MGVATCTDRYDVVWRHWFNAVAALCTHFILYDTVDIGTNMTRAYLLLYPAAAGNKNTHVAKKFNRYWHTLTHTHVKIIITTKRKKEEKRKVLNRKMKRSVGRSVGDCGAARMSSAFWCSKQTHGKCSTVRYITRARFTAEPSRTMPPLMRQ